MGYAFTFPLVRMIAGSEIAIGAYVHYPTVSADMVKRVRERSFGVENAGASRSRIRTRVKLVYVHRNAARVGLLLICRIAITASSPTCMLLLYYSRNIS